MTDLPVVPSTRDPRPGLSAVQAAELGGWFVDRNEPPYRSQQVRDAVWRTFARSAEEVRTLPTPIRAALAESYRVDTIAETELTLADGGLTEKALHRLSDGQLIESVLMHYPSTPARRERHTLCISSQAGCAVG